MAAAIQDAVQCQLPDLRVALRCPTTTMVPCCREISGTQTWPGRYTMELGDFPVERLFLSGFPSLPRLMTPEGGGPGCGENDLGQKGPRRLTVFSPLQVRCKWRLSAVCKSRVCRCGCVLTASPVGRLPPFSPWVQAAKHDCLSRWTPVKEETSMCGDPDLCSI